MMCIDGEGPQKVHKNIYHEKTMTELSSKSNVHNCFKVHFYNNISVSEFNATFFLYKIMSPCKVRNYAFFVCDD